VAVTRGLLGGAAQAGTGTTARVSISASTNPEDTVKLICGKCRRVMDVRKKDVDEVCVCIDGCRPILVRREHEEAKHLVCPFCTVEGNGVFWLAQLKKLDRAVNQGEAA
jgi:hypothetical protein